MRRWILLAAMSIAAVACTSSAGRSSSPAAEPVNPVNPVDSLLAVIAGQYDLPEQTVMALAGTYGDYQLSEEDRNRLAEGFAAVSPVDGKLHDTLLPALKEELRLCETFADVCRRLGLTVEE